MNKPLLVIFTVLLIVMISNPTTNPIANMYGGEFLIFYALTIALTVAICWLSIRSLDRTTNLPPPLIPSQPNPQEIAYLRGGENEVTRLVIFDLIQRGYLQVQENKIERSPNNPDLLNLSSLETEIFRFFATLKTVSKIFNSGLLAKVKEYFVDCERQLQNQQILFSEETKNLVRHISSLGTSVILGLGGYKLVISLIKGRSNVGFLIVMAIFSITFLYAICQTPRLTQRGKTYLKRLQQAFGQLKQQTTTIDSSFDPQNSNLSLLVAVFGVSVLAGTPFSSISQTFERSSVSGGSSGSCGSSCGGGGCGGGCGGCGGD